MIGSIRKILTALTEMQTLRHNNFVTLLIEVDNILNSRPLVPLLLHDFESETLTAYKALLQNRSELELQSRYLETQKAANSAVNQSKEKCWEKVWSSAGIKL